MPVQATIVLDSGCFLPMTNRSCDIGYYQCEASVSDIKIFVDGEELSGLPSPFKLCESGKKCVMTVRHKGKNGNPKTNGITVSRTFHDQLLHLKDLYDNLPNNHQPVERDKFDCVIHLDSGHFCASMVKKRDFREYKKQPNGTFKHDPRDPPKTTATPVSHNVIVHFTLDEDESLELARDNSTIWSSKTHNPSRRVEIEIVADNSTAEKFFREALKDAAKSSYWLPNQGDPPPSCPTPPCPVFP